MTTSTPNPSSTDYFTSRPALRTRPPSSALGGRAGGQTPNSPRTPLLARSISGQFGSPAGSFRTEQEDHLVYELGARHLSAGLAGESRARCILCFKPGDGRRVGDYRDVEPGYRRGKRRELSSKELDEGWGEGYELYRSDVRALDLGLVEDKLERAVRKIHTDYLQLDQKPRKAVLAIPSLLPTPLLEIVLKVLFNHHAQPPSIVLLTIPLLACVGAGLRNALVVDLGWEESVVTAIGEYREVFRRRSVRAGKMLTREMAKLLQEEVKNQSHVDSSLEGAAGVTFEYAEEVTRRMGWCRARSASSSAEESAASTVKLPSPDPEDQTNLHISFNQLSKPAETTLFTSADPSSGGGFDDDHDLTIPHLAYRVLLALPLDLRALCTSRLILTGGLSNLPGLKPRLLQELSHLITTRGWDAVNNYGSATAHHERILKQRSANITTHRQQQEQHPNANEEKEKGIKPPLSPTKKPLIPHAHRLHDDDGHPYTLEIQRAVNKGKVDPGSTFKGGTVRGVETLGAWAGASLLASLRVKGVHEVERDEFIKYGLRETGWVG